MIINFTDQELRSCYHFALAMRDNHNNDMIQHRDDWEIFRDDFRGKLGEIAVMNYIKSAVPSALITGNIDFRIMPRGQWDTTDLIINNKYINVKSIKQGSNFLLVETLRYDADGHYAYNNHDGKPVKIDGYILVRVNVEPDVQRNIFRQDFESFCRDGFDPHQKKSVPRKFSAEILGGITHEDFWAYKHFAPKGIRCDYRNLNAIINGCHLDQLPDPVCGNEPAHLILQKDNYVIGCSHLQPLERLFVPAHFTAAVRKTSLNGQTGRQLTRVCSYDDHWKPIAIYPGMIQEELFSDAASIKQYLSKKLLIPINTIQILESFVVTLAPTLKENRPVFEIKSIASFDEQNNPVLTYTHLGAFETKEAALKYITEQCHIPEGSIKLIN